MNAQKRAEHDMMMHFPNYFFSLCPVQVHGVWCTAFSTRQLKAVTRDGKYS